jgi:lipid-binding SYLF domain-containing protein
MRKKFARAALLSVLWAGFLHAGKTRDIERLSRSASVLQEILTAPDRGIPQDLIDKAQCVVVVPGLKKAAFFFGGKYGRGYFSCRKVTGAGWTGPAAVRVEGGSFGIQIGGSETDTVLLIMNRRGMDRLLSSKFTVGGEGEATAGPVGRTADAQTDAFMTAKILAYSRSRGIFGGVSVSGATLRQDLDVNEALYGKDLTNRQIVERQIPAPAEAREWTTILNKYSSRKG